ncbi:hypothetical protein [Enterobacter cancerogenus]|jgi:hypothetical protein|uniref:hypothetical protein n=1 Tax=Enterobacter cancerogenus TaxID=69218 RepID=UPI000538AA5C|nr:hypothetical protein [Enterobacter cancerogenus]KGT85967.1 hypothetical protein NH00_26390 [Enterobacter cancerogenus]
MNGLQRYLPDQRFLILLNRFIVRYDESECNKEKIVKDAYLFCVGYFFKYQHDYENPYLKGPSNIIAVLSSALLSSNFYTIPSTISLDRILYFYKFIVEYIIWNEHEVETVFKNQELGFRKENSCEIKESSFRKKKRL